MSRFCIALDFGVACWANWCYLFTSRSISWDLEGPKTRQISKSSMSTASSEVEQMDDHEASAAALDSVVSISLYNVSMSS